MDVANPKPLWFILIGAFIVIGGIMMIILIAGGNTPDHIDLPPNDPTSSPTSTP